MHLLEFLVCIKFFSANLLSRTPWKCLCCSFICFTFNFVSSADDGGTISTINIFTNIIGRALCYSSTCIDWWTFIICINNLIIPRIFTIWGKCLPTSICCCFRINIWSTIYRSRGSIIILNSITDICHKQTITANLFISNMEWWPSRDIGRTRCITTCYICLNDNLKVRKHFNLFLIIIIN